MHDQESRNAIIITTDQSADDEESLSVSCRYAGKPVVLAEAICLVLESNSDENLVGAILRAAMHKYALRMNKQMVEKWIAAGQEIAEHEPTTTESNE